MAQFSMEIIGLTGSLQHGNQQRQAYARLILNEVRVTEDEIRINGSKSVLAKTASDDTINASPGVLSFVREWRAQKDSNL